MSLTIGSRIRTARESKGLSQGQLQKKTGIKREYLSKLENDELKNPTIGTLSKIAKGCDLTLVELLGGKEKNATDLELAEVKSQLTQKEEALNEVYSFLEPVVSGRGK